MYNRKTRYRFYTPSGRTPFAAEDAPDTDKQPIQDPDKNNTDAPDTADDDLKNVDQSKGGYGAGSGFGPDRT